MTALDFNLSGDGIAISLHVTSELPDSGQAASQIYTQVITTLIEEAHTEMWEKDAQELRADEFWAEVLEALARHFAVSLADEEPRRAHERLTMLIDNLRQQGRLQEWLPNRDSDMGKG